MQYKLLVSDFDNTLVPFGEPKPRPAVVKAVKKLQAAGVKFALSTGRAYPCVHREQLGGIRPDYIVTCNGACVTDAKGTVVAEHPLTNEEMYALVDFCEDYNYPLQFNFRDACYVYCEYEALRNNYAKMGSSGLTCVDGEDQDRHLIDMPHSAFAAVPPEHVADFMKKYGHLNLNWMQVGAKNADGYCFYDIVPGMTSSAWASTAVRCTTAMPCATPTASSFTSKMPVTLKSSRRRPRSWTRTR